MVELTIGGQVYPFHFGVGFLREMNKKVSIPVESVPGKKKDVGFKYYTAELLDGDIEALMEILDTANKGQEPRLTKAVLEAYIDDPDTDIEELFDQVKGFLSDSNATKKDMKILIQAIEEEKSKGQAQEA